MNCATCGKAIASTWVKRQPISYAYYATSAGLIVLCSAECEQQWIDEPKRAASVSQ